MLLSSYHQHVFFHPGLDDVKKEVRQEVSGVVMGASPPLRKNIITSIIIRMLNIITNIYVAASSFFLI